MLKSVVKPNNNHYVLIFITCKLDSIKQLHARRRRGVIVMKAAVVIQAIVAVVWCWKIGVITLVCWHNVNQVWCKLSGRQAQSFKQGGTPGDSCKVAQIRDSPNASGNNLNANTIREISANISREIRCNKKTHGGFRAQVDQVHF